MVAKIVTISLAQAGGTTVELAEMKGANLLLLRGGVPFEDFNLLAEGGFQLTSSILVLNEKFAVFPLIDYATGIPGGFGASQYPHLIVLTTVSDTVQDAQGNWTAGTVETLEALRCRFEANSKGAMIPSADGTKVDFDGTVYMPLPVLDILPGTKAVVYNNAKVLSNNKIIRFSKGQLNARLWL